MKKKKWIISLVITIIIAFIIVILETKAIGIWKNKQNVLANKKPKTVVEKVDKTVPKVDKTVETDNKKVNANSEDSTKSTSTQTVKQEDQPKVVQNVQVQAQPETKPVVNYIGCNDEGDLYAYDAKEVQQRITTKNYSNNGQKIVFLTFDDGPSLTVTPTILDILDKENVKATFMVTGSQIDKGGEKAKALIKREFNSGHAIGNHSYSHSYATLYPNRTLNLNNFLADYSKTDDILKSILGSNFSTNVIRCPGGHMSWQGMSALDTYLSQNNKASIDWNALCGDAEAVKRNSDQLVQYTQQTSQGKDIVVILMHDTYGKEDTANALMRIIEYFKTSGYQFRTLK